MNRRTLLALTTAALLSGCVSTPPAATQDELNNAMDAQLAKMETLMAQRCDQQQEVYQEQLEQQQVVITELRSINATLAEVDSNTTTPVPVCPEVTADPLSDKLVLGEVERVYVQEVGEAFEARVDTGAASSSISAANIRLFERDGDQWVRFDVPLPGADAPVEVSENGEGEAEAAAEQTEQAKQAGPANSTIEAKVARFVLIKRASAAESERRPVIMARLKIGDFVAETELNLTDRSHMEYPLLLGRKFFKDIAVVDVSGQYILSGDK
ncbi:ATP-dependent zinc protease family protein [Ferrimonas marina]|uniref:Uncharacterized conserved protein n=1 Tax=Ferrimonas marina TaxID=299255 RepID=A0A1M5MZY3_9GAMM|nr:RimK/LysX family protein [Ferrimonas marina]SHG82874.1 Uncharacterized conserved protein [Ferrimonas marina]